MSSASGDVSVRAGEGGGVLRGSDDNGITITGLEGHSDHHLSLHNVNQYQLKPTLLNKIAAEAGLVTPWWPRSRKEAIRKAKNLILGFRNDELASEARANY